MSESNGWIVSFFEDVSQEQIDEYESEIEQAGGNIIARLPIIRGFAATIPEPILSEFQTFHEQGTIVKGIEPNGYGSGG